jgi:hypothetical protein
MTLLSGTFGTIGTDLGAMAWLEGVNEQVLIIDTGDVTRDLALQSEQPTFQILSRGGKNDDLQVAHDKLRAIHEFLLPLGTTIINGEDYLSFFPVSGPTGIGRDDNDRAVFTANYSTFRNPL